MWNRCFPAFRGVLEMPMVTLCRNMEPTIVKKLLYDFPAVHGYVLHIFCVKKQGKADHPIFRGTSRPAASCPGRPHDEEECFHHVTGGQWPSPGGAGVCCFCKKTTFFPSGAVSRIGRMGWSMLFLQKNNLFSPSGAAFRRGGRSGSRKIPAEREVAAHGQYQKPPGIEKNVIQYRHRLCPSCEAVFHRGSREPRHKARSCCPQ